MKYDKAWVERARKDLLTLLGNFAKVETERDRREVVDGVRGYYRRVLGGHIFQGDPGGHGTIMGLLQALHAKGDGEERGGEGGRRIEFVNADVSAPFGALNGALSDFLYFSRSAAEMRELGLHHVPAYSTLEEWKKGALKYKDRAMRAARKLWDALATWGEKHQNLFDVPNRETRTKIAGFDVVLDDYDPDSEPALERYSTRALAEWTEALTRFRGQALKVMPAMVRQVVPFHLIFRIECSKGGSYSAGSPRTPAYINLFACGNRGNIDEQVHVIAHEMGHHLYRVLLSQAARDDWEATITGSRVELNVEEILAKWPKSEPWAYNMARHTPDDPIFGLRVAALAQRHGYQKRSEYEALIAKGITTIDAPETPITGYAEKNAEESFCEAVGRLVAYGTGAVHPRVRHWLDAVVDHELRLGHVAGAARKGRAATQRGTPRAPRAAYAFLPLSTVKVYEAEARRLGVSKVARSATGFLAAYKRAGGVPERLSEAWIRKREGFIARHMAEAKNNGESFALGDKLTRRHLALIMWAYSPKAKAVR